MISGAALYGLGLLQANTQKMYDKDLIGISLLRSLNRDLNVIGRYVNRVILEVDAGNEVAAKKDIEKIAKVKSELLANYEKSKGTIIRPELVVKINEVGSTINEVMLAVDNVTSTALSKGGASAAYKIIDSKEYRDLFSKVGNEIKEIGLAKTEGAAKNMEAASEAASSMKWLIGVLLA